MKLGNLVFLAGVTAFLVLSLLAVVRPENLFHP
jgi:hypothetical protein